MKQTPKSKVSTGKTPSPASGGGGGSNRKLVQARLPFLTLSAPTPSKSSCVSTPTKIPSIEVRKRRLSPTTSDEQLPTAKVNRTNDATVSNESKKTKENVQQVPTTIDLSDDDHETKETSAKEPTKHENDEGTSKRKKRKKNKLIKTIWSEPKSDDTKSDESKISVKLPISRKRKLSAKKQKTRSSDRLKNDVVQQILVQKASELKKSQVDDDSDLELSSDDEMPESSKKPIEISDEEEAATKSENSNPSNSSEAKIESTTNEISLTVDDKLDLETKNDQDSVVLTTTSHRDELNTPNQKMTPKQQQRKLDSEKKQLERQKAKEERDRKVNEERKQKQEERDEKERQKKREREEKEEQRRKEKDERDRKRQAEIDAKNEEKRKREEQKEEEKRKREEQKDEERRKKEEERLAIEEAKSKKVRKESEAFTKFFKTINKKSEADDAQPEKTECNFMPFQIKEEMQLAPIVRRNLSDNQKHAFDEIIIDQNAQRNDLYLSNLKNGKQIPGKCDRTWKNYEEDIQIIDELEGTAVALEEEKVKQTYRTKYLKFVENQRPAYFGTWRKNSQIVKARKPFATDNQIFDYDVDSDDEWEEEEPGESLHGSDDEKESIDDYDIDNEFMVPHGHLSDEELQKDGDDEDNSPKMQKEKLKLIQKQFADERSKKTEKIKPRLVGLVWQNSSGGQPSTCPNIVWDLLMARAMLLEGTSILMAKKSNKIDADDADSGDENADAAKQKKKKRVQLSDEVVKDLIRLIHGNVNNKKFLAQELQTFLMQKQSGGNDDLEPPSKMAIRLKIKELASWKACPDEGPFNNKFCWYVNADTMERYGVSDATIPNSWQYNQQNPRKMEIKEKPQPIVTDPAEAAAAAMDEGKQNAKGKSTTQNGGGIAKFTTILTKEELKKSFTTSIPNGSKQQSSTSTLSTDTNTKTATNQSNSTTNETKVTPRSKKRVQLLKSFPLGQEIPSKRNNALISQFLSDGTKVNSDKQKRNNDKSDPNNSIVVLE